LLLARPKGDQGGGDIYCIHSCDNGVLAKFVLLDLTGHGQARDALARGLHDLLHGFGDETQPARLLELLNQQYSPISYPAIYATAVSAAYEPRQNEFRFSNAGHPRPLHWSARNRRWNIVRPAEESDCGLPIGVRETACYTEENIPLCEGDILLLSSDGLPETRNEREEFLKPEGVLKFLQEFAAEAWELSPLVKLAAAFLRRLSQYRGGREFEDDITLLWLRRLPADPSRGARTPGR
jgi:serine phosphatase RsbU (regulator of sigma subunit)